MVIYLSTITHSVDHNSIRCQVSCKMKKDSQKSVRKILNHKIEVIEFTLLHNWKVMNIWQYVYFLSTFYKTVPVLLSLHPSLTFPFHVLPSPVHLIPDFLLWFSHLSSHLQTTGFPFPGAPYQICHLFLHKLPCHFYLVVITTTKPVLSCYYRT